VIRRVFVGFFASLAGVLLVAVPVALWWTVFSEFLAASTPWAAVGRFATAFVILPALLVYGLVWCSQIGCDLDAADKARKEARS
jgi:hypothetical protein